VGRTHNLLSLPHESRSEQTQKSVRYTFTLLLFAHCALHQSSAARGCSIFPLTCLSPRSPVMFRNFLLHPRLNRSLMPAVSRPLLIFHSIFLQTLFKMSFATFLFSNSGSQSSLCLGFTPRKLSACLPTSGHSRIITERNILRIIQLLTFSPFFGRQIKVIAPLRLLSLRILSPLSSLLLLPKMPLTLTAHT